MRKSRFTILAAGSILLIGALIAGCEGVSLDETTPVAGQTEVDVVDNSFESRVIEVPAGTEITWNWDRADRDHNVVGEGFTSQVQKDGTFAHTFNDPGVYDYRCTLHGGMTGRVIVKES